MYLFGYLVICECGAGGAQSWTFCFACAGFSPAFRAGGQGAQAGRGGFAGQAGADGAAGATEGGGIRVEVEVPVCRQQGALQLEGELPRVAACWQLSFGLGVPCCAFEGVHPLVLALGYAAADGAWRLAVELG